jgi:hypothetical protein
VPGPIISGLIALVVVYLLSKAVRAEPAQRSGKNWVEFGLGYKVLAVLFFPFSAFVTYAASHASADQKSLALFIAAAFWVMSVYLAYAVFFTHLSYDDDFIYCWTPRQRQRQIPWSAVNDLRYSALTQAYSLKTNGFGQVSISPQANGSQALIDRAINQLESLNKLNQDG